MKTPKKILVLCTAVISTTALVSWDHLNRSAKKINTSKAEISALATDDDWFGFPSASNTLAPPAEDVLIQKIPGDNNHLLIMAFYSRENYSGPSFILENGGNLL